MRMKITVTKEEATSIVTTEMRSRYDAEVEVDIAMPEPVKIGITALDKLTLIRFLRTAIVELSRSRQIKTKDGFDNSLDSVPIENDMRIGLVDAKTYVEKYFNF